MKWFYEVRKQLHNPNQWMKIAFFENEEDAKEFILCSSEIAEERPSVPDFDNPQYKIVPHRFNELKEYQFAAPEAQKK
jgi:hypothetical protein|tara:strand:- start:231 stop:464 length:234 start_codon:yes stop_codon:yes gene_type:complete